MKKLFTIVAVAMFSLVMVACASGVEKGKKIVDKQVKALAEGDLQELMELEIEYQEHYKTLSTEEKAELDLYVAKTLVNLGLDDDYDDYDDYEEDYDW